MTPPALLAQDLHKTYRLGRVAVPVLRGVSLTVAEGEFVAILGASGSGKSTLLHLLGGLDRPDRVRPDRGGPDRVRPDRAQPAATPAPGTIAFRGRSLSAMSSRELDRYRSRDVGFVFQFYHLLPELTVLQNVLLASMVRHGLAYPGSAPSADAAARALLETLGLAHRLRHRPAELSGGERQRVAIARALINNPAVLLADEPTGNLDQRTGATILDMLLTLRAQKQLTMVVVTHDANTAARADRVVRLVDGLIVSADPPANAPPDGQSSNLPSHARMPQAYHGS